MNANNTQSLFADFKQHDIHFYTMGRKKVPLFKDNFDYHEPTSIILSLLH